MSARRQQIWIGLNEVRPRAGKTELLGDAKGAFVTIVTWAIDAEQYRQKVEELVDSLGALFVSDVVGAEPVDDRRARIGGDFEDAIEDLISRARDNRNAILYGTFHLFTSDDA